MPSPLVLFIAEGCRYSRELMNNYGECLTRISDRIFYFDAKDKNTKRKRITQSAIEYHQIKQFPSLVCENGTILQSANSIATAIQELCQVTAHPANTSVKPDVNGNVKMNTTLQHHGASQDLSHLGMWPSQDQPAGPPDPRQMQGQQQGQGYPPQGQQGYPPQHGQQGYPSQGQHQGYPPQQQQQGYPQQGAQQQQQGLTGYDPYDYQNDNGQGGYQGIGTGGMVGAGEMNMAAPNDNGNTADTAIIGQWPTSKKVNGLTGSNGVTGGGQRERTNQVYQQKGQMNQQQTGMMMNNYGQPVAQAYQMY